MQKLLILVGILVFALVTPEISQAALVPCQNNCGSCELVQLANTLISWLIGILFLIFAVLMTIAGFGLVTSGGNQAALSAAKEKFKNALIGIIIVFAAWLLVDTLLKGLLPNGNTSLGPWNSVICIYQSLPRVFNAAELRQGYGEVDPATAAATYVAGDCSPVNLENVGFTPQQAQVFSCIARAESNCNLNARNPSSSAAGVFQILRGYNNECHNLNLPECTSAVGATENLNCSRFFRGGQVRSGYEAQAATCDAAASNFSCNAAAARCLFEGRDSSGPGGYAPWLGNPGQNHHLAQRACVARYGG